MAAPQPVSTTSADILADRLAQLQALIPEAFSEGRIDWDKLRDALGDIVDGAPERYSFTWAGKRDAIRLLQTPTRATLLPCPDESVNWDATQHLFIEGDNLEVLKLLYKPYFGRVKMIYIDPPYNTGNDFVYPDDYADPLGRYLEITGQRDAEGNLLTSNPETSGRYHSAWLSMMYPRLFIARQLLREDGVILVSIGEQEVHNLRLLVHEIFGEENLVATIVWQKAKRGDAKLIAQNHEYILVAAKNKISVLENGNWRIKKAGVDQVLAYYSNLRQKLGNDHTSISDAMKGWFASLSRDDPRRKHKHYSWSDDRGLYFADNFAGPDDGRKSRPRYDIIHPVTGKPCKKPSTGWRWDEARTKKALAMNPPLIHFGPDETTIPCRKTYLEKTSEQPFSSVFYCDGRAATLELERLVGPRLMNFPKNSDILKQFIQLICDPNAVVLDFFAGSCTTAQAVLELNREDGSNRRFVMVQLPEPTGNPDFPTIAEVGKERIRRVIRQMQGNGENGQLALDMSGNEDLGFKVFKLAPSHIRPWPGVEDATPEAYAGQMALFDDPLVDGWTVEGLAYEIALKEGYSLNCRIEPARNWVFDKNPVSQTWQITDDEKAQSFTLCLANEVPADIVAMLDLSKDDLFVCRDAALTDDLAANLALQCRLKTI